VQQYNAGSASAAVRLWYRSAEPNGASVPFTVTLGAPAERAAADRRNGTGRCSPSARKLAILTVGYRQAQTADHWFISQPPVS
jgi:hypothetical protein